MNRRQRAWVGLPLVAFTATVILVQLWASLRRFNSIEEISQSNTLAGLYQRSKYLERIHDMGERTLGGPAFDLRFPKDVKVFMPEMTGPTNFWKREYFYRMTYFLFPREVAVSLDGPARQTREGFLGRTCLSDQEIGAHGYDVSMRFAPTYDIRARRGLVFLPAGNPYWFDSKTDISVAFLLPLFTAGSGILLMRVLFPQLAAKLLAPERMACGFGLGMMSVTALTLAVKLCGFHGYRVVFRAAAIGSLLEVSRNRRSYWTAITGWSSKALGNPASIGIALIGLLAFVLLFRQAGLMGMNEYDATMSWALKAKIMNLYAGHDLVRWFSNPRLAHAHLDYPPLVPALHAATFDSIGHADDFVTKFWPAWMLLFLVAAIASLARGKNGRFVVLGILLLPATLLYAQWEGATMPMVFFMVLGCLQCCIGIIEREPVRLCLGLTLLFGGAMTKFEGIIFLMLAAGSLLLLPAARFMLRVSLPSWRVAFFCFAVVLPYICLRAQIPSLNFESNWAGNILIHPGETLANWPAVFLMMFARLFVSPELGEWIDDDGHFRWHGHWSGFSSLFDASTLGLAWLCVAMTVVLWFKIPERRAIISWVFAMVVGMIAFQSFISAGFVSSHDAQYLVDAGKLTPRYYIPLLGSTQRYFFPALLTWFATILTVTFRYSPTDELELEESRSPLVRALT